MNSVFEKNFILEVILVKYEELKLCVKKVGVIVFV